jgi:hypothetical protein
MLTEVRRAAALFPGRAACLEVSLASVLWAAARRRRLEWCWGVHPYPYTFHAWVETLGRRVQDGSPEPYDRLIPVDIQD